MKICIVGGGNMATALIGGLLNRGYASSKIRVVEINPESCVRLHEEFTIRADDDLEGAVRHSEIIMLAVKPQQLRDIALRIAPLISGHLIISIAAGIRAADIARWTGTQNIVRCMPNTPALIRAGMSGLYALDSVSAEQRKAVESILAAVGRSLWVSDETMLDAVTAISGSGPAYVFYFIEALQQAAEQLGFNHDEARKLSLATFLGASKLAAGSPEDVGVLRARVTSKNGTTERALMRLDERQVAAHIIEAAHAAAERAREMGDELGAA
ncbi:MAG: pyrroline-5-carboxylate reductase [Gallionella sp.]|nr:pyrroline-5-carboxylate reductase [Gallionella sp.]